jgi:hypothetical protein
MTSLLRRIDLVSSDIARRSFPAMSGAAMMAHSEKWVLYSSKVMPPLPTSSMSGSFHRPGPANLLRPSAPTFSTRVACRSRMRFQPISQPLRPS